MTNPTSGESKDFDLHPSLYRASKDGQELHVPNKEEVKKLHEHVKDPPAPTGDESDLHPSQWKQEMDKQKIPDWDLYPNVNRQFQDGAELHIMSESKRNELKKQLKPPQNNTSEPDLHPQEMRRSTNQ